MAEGASKGISQAGKGLAMAGAAISSEGYKGLNHAGRSLGYAGAPSASPASAGPRAARGGRAFARWRFFLALSTGAWPAQGRKFSRGRRGRGVGWRGAWGAGWTDCAPWAGCSSGWRRDSGWRRAKRSTMSRTTWTCRRAPSSAAPLASPWRAQPTPAAALCKAGRWRVWRAGAARVEQILNRPGPLCARRLGRSCTRMLPWTCGRKCGWPCCQTMPPSLPQPPRARWPRWG